MSHVLFGIGYRVRSAEDGISAVVEIGNEIHDIILSDLNLPSVSSFELLSMIRRRYPSIRVIAMSGAFSGKEASSGIAADAFYQKGCGVGSLLRIIRALPQSERKLLDYPAASAPIWSHHKGHDISGEPHATIGCAK
jgi:DNA-binding NtrC family response regulator